MVWEGINTEWSDGEDVRWIGLHATNFDSVTGKFNSDMMLKSLVFIGRA